MGAPCQGAMGEGGEVKEEMEVDEEVEREAIHQYDHRKGKMAGQFGEQLCLKTRY